MNGNAIGLTGRGFERTLGLVKSRTGLGLAVCLGLIATNASAAELGGVFNGMFLDALKIARQRWHPDACLAAFTYDFEPEGIMGVPNRDEEIYKYDFYSPGAPTEAYHVSFSNRDNWLPEEKTGGISNSARCIARMPITIDSALARARKAGLMLGPKTLLEIARDRFDKEDLRLGRLTPPAVAMCELCRRGGESEGVEKTAAAVPLGKELWVVAALGEKPRQGEDNGDPKVTSLVVLDSEKGKVLRVKRGDPHPAVDAR